MDVKADASGNSTMAVEADPALASVSYVWILKLMEENVIVV